MCVCVRVCGVGVWCKRKELSEGGGRRACLSGSRLKPALEADREAAAVLVEVYKPQVQTL